MEANIKLNPCLLPSDFYIITPMKTPSAITFWTTLGLLTVISAALSISLGSTHDSWPAFVHGLTQNSTLLHTIIFKLRMPRTFCAFIVGGLLALAGGIMQTLLRNPLADPYVLGVSGGAALMGLIAILLGFSTHYLTLWTFIGSLLSIFLVIGLANRHHRWSPLHLLLTGIVVATAWSALISLILTVSPESNLRSMLFWLMGDLNYAQFSLWQPAILILGLMLSLMLAKPLNVLAHGELSSRSLGINTRRLNFFLYLISSLLTAAAVSIAGCIGFVGLIIPHMLRLIVGSDHRIILPASVLLGGSLLTLADTLARTVTAPVQLPVGIVMAIIGVPCFLLLLQRGQPT